jgi:AAA15 family ATPase/GTPase
MMANAPGFRSLYNLRHIHFEEVYADIIDRVFLGSLIGSTDTKRKKLLAILQRAMDGKIISKNEEFFLKNKQGELEFTLLAEGIRKLGLLWVLIQNGTLINGAILCWDEPETNLNPKLMRTVVEILLELQRMGVQIFLTTHDYVVLKEFDLQAKNTDKLLFHSLYRNTGEIEVASTESYLNISPNVIDDSFGSIVDREINKSMGNLGK